MIQYNNYITLYVLLSRKDILNKFTILLAKGYLERNFENVQLNIQYNTKFYTTKKFRMGHLGL